MHNLLYRGVKTVKVSDALNIAKSFAVVQLNADLDSINFLSAKVVGSNWEIICVFKDKNAKVGIGTTICISDTSGEVTGFTTKAVKALG